MRTYSAGFLILAFLGAITGCKEAGSDGLTQPTLSLVLKYTSFDTSGLAVAKGWLALNIKDSANFTGKWNIQLIGHPDPGRVGPQSGQGKLTGHQDGTKVFVELHPGFVDNNLGLLGEMDSGTIRGEWQWTSYVGLSGHGTFEATAIW